MLNLNDISADIFYLESAWRMNSDNYIQVYLLVQMSDFDLRFPNVLRKHGLFPTIFEPIFAK